MPYIDAHSHLHFQELLSLDLSDYWRKITLVVVNGTSPRDWRKVASLYEKHPDKVVPHFGVHPWKTNTLFSGWKQDLKCLLRDYPKAGVGEIGLDKWVKGHDLTQQLPVFRAQIELALELKRPLSIHCLQAWGTLNKVISEYGEVRALLHAYSGASEMLEEFSHRGAYFSFSPYFLHERKEKQRAVFQRVPRERLLLETDAPEMLGPELSWSVAQRSFSEKSQHPENIFALYHTLASFLKIEPETLEKQAERNCREWLGLP